MRYVNIVNSRDIRFTSAGPISVMIEGNEMSETRIYIEKFKPVGAEHYYNSLWNDPASSVEVAPRKIRVLHEGRSMRPRHKRGSDGHHVPTNM